MIELLGFLITGMILGFAAGISPGPLLALVFSETLRHGRKERIKIALSPLISDLPIILFVLFLLSDLIKYGNIIGLINLFGAVYLFYLGVLNLRASEGKFKSGALKKDALKQGVIANLLSPYPYLFWITIGGPIIFQGLEVSITAAALFIIGFYGMLTGSKIGFALITEKNQNIHRKQKIYLSHSCSRYFFNNFCVNS